MVIRSLHCEIHGTVPEKQVQQRTKPADLSPLRKWIAGGRRQLHPERFPGEEFVEHKDKEDRYQRTKLVSQLTPAGERRFECSCSLATEQLTIQAPREFLKGTFARV